MTCDKCGWWRRLFCIAPCADMQEQFNRWTRTQWRRQMRKHRGKKFMAALTISVILGIVAWAATLPPMVPDNVNVADLNGACRHSARVMVGVE